MLEDKVLDKALNAASAAEVYSETSTSMTVAFEANRCHAIENKTTAGIGLRVIWNQHIGFSSTTNLGRADELIDTAVATAKFGEPAGFELPGPQSLPEPLIANSRISLLPADLMKMVGDNVLELCREQVPDMKVDLNFHKSGVSVRLVNSSGFDAGYERANYSLDFSGLQIVDSSLVWFYDFLNLSRDAHFDAEVLVGNIAALARLARRTAPLTSGRYPCLFVDTAPLSLLAAISAGVNGKNLEKGTSPLIGRENEPVLNEKITIWDDTLKANSFRSAPFDGEGMPGRKTPLFERGKFRNFLFDLKTAAAVERRSTGSAGRSFASRPVPAGSNLVVDPGRLNLAKTIAGMREGLVIYGTVGGGQSNLLAGDFSMGISLGFKVENGEVVGRVKDAMVAGNVYEALRDGADLGDTPKDYGSVSVPFFYFPALTVATRT
jgi:PmbA protein